MTCNHPDELDGVTVTKRPLGPGGDLVCAECLKERPELLKTIQTNMLRGIATRDTETRHA